jgi:hypothetical protein
MKLIYVLRVTRLLVLAGTVAVALQWHKRSSDPLPAVGAPVRAVWHLAAMGFDNLVADVLFLQFLQYFGASVRVQRPVCGAAPWLELITELDPRFLGAYALGTMALADAQEFDAVERLWHQAQRALPGDWRVPYQAGMTLFLFAREPAHAAQAALWFRRAAELPGAPAEARYMEARMYQVGERRQMAIALWRDIYLHDERVTARAVAKKALQSWGVPLPPSP